MIANTRLAVAAHIVSYLARARGRCTSSRCIAASVNTNPAFVRRILCQLVAAGLVAAEKGKAGGFRLAVSPRDLTLWDLAVALGEVRLLAVHKNAPNPRCELSCRMKEALGRAFAMIEAAAQDRMRRVTITALLG